MTGTVASADGRMPELDGLRGFAALSVFAFHGYFLANWPAGADQPLLLALQRLLALGWSGVDIFFTLSAFLLSLQWLRSEPVAERSPRSDTARYLARRALRILPAFWVQVLLLALLMPAAPASLTDLAAQWLLLFNLGAEPARPWVSVWWTLPLEAGFYLLLPLLAPLLRPGRWGWLLIGIVGAWAYRWLLLDADLPKLLQVVWVDHLPGRVDQFLIGMLGAYAWRSWAAGALASSPHRTAAALAGLGCCALVLWLPYALDARAGPGPSAHPALIAWHGYASVALLPVLWAAACGGGWLLGWLGSRPMRALGAISFSLYLWHMPLMLLARPHLEYLADGPTRPLAFIAIMLLPCIIVAWLSWRLVEQPAMRWGRRHLSADRGGSAAAPIGERRAL